MDTEIESVVVADLPDVVTPRHYQLPEIHGRLLPVPLTLPMSHDIPVLAQYRACVGSWLKTFTGQYAEYSYGVGEVLGQRSTAQAYYIEIVYEPANHEFYDIDVNIGLGPWVVTQPVSIPLFDSDRDYQILGADYAVVGQAVRSCWIKLVTVTKALETLTRSVFTNVQKEFSLYEPKY